ncbi:hypothetical protein [Burkholderia gladioli]|uniref:hypothetical protein n=1 Tax=Burkholderia gladioli TaxID=28095 RepID=UPI0016408B8A|nr:hypothetical protein [Burkholderia gladioli]
MEQKPFDQMTNAEQNALVDEWIRESKANPVHVVMPREASREGYYHVRPDPIA